MKKYEYLLEAIAIQNSENKIKEVLNEKGSDGWELINFTQKSQSQEYLFAFKKKVSKVAKTK